MLLFHFLLTYIFISRCSTCKEKNKERCYHWSVGDEAALSSFQEQLEKQYANYLRNCGSSYDEVQRRTKIIYDPCDVTREANK